MRILLTGIGGQLGGELQQILTPLGEVTGVNRQSLDLAQPTQIRQIIGEVKPDIIVNAAAYTAVDKAETEIELANAINGNAPTIMAEEAHKLGAAIIHVSTDYVFDGQKNTPYKEDDTTNPINAYGRSKLLGEEGVKSHCHRYIILRTAWVYSCYGNGNFVKTMLRLGAEREEIRVVVDQVGTPTWTRDIAQAILQLGKKITLDIPDNSSLTGIYHFTNSGAISWYDFAVSIFEEAEKLGFPLKVQRVIPITTSEYPTPAARPAYSVLSNQKISKILGNNLPYWRNGLRQMLQQLYSESVISS
ncbi:dTDP-4-dehydrorhamnose reductase [Symplocastrum sp. BBK-W-15]|uniref:dTDP-4-dehydrorhamnose reductase n=2 Tax=Limnofasciculus TaxID=3064905 RepID=A0AAE3GNW1_9CYAN|nr:dTDP-4-dehydrorhamnose reductase [Limnofasciculus baicalensis]MCP2727419.1 dTDP-4-dehydrorhamnose reductase [Limnofasciculus baicalensis BBK-W-15]